MRRSGAAPVIAAILVAALAGCGSDDGATTTTAARPRAAVGPSLDRLGLERALSNGVRAGLYRVAVMSQHSDDAKDLGQPLPTGVVDGVRCAPGGAGATRCVVRWRTVDRARRRTAYRVRLRPGGCFVAAADPARDTIYDATIRSYAEDPLNVIQTVGRRC
ncbi:hypothetical protein PAI11_12670 [Patulibacter medicamentivorans]|uniref:Lipoprotein n=1 Tax=Patulibacter medicamentivorans TaxID=1097667 RepID=H0E399_9ACTN|nr:hypothetical protein [Patulibacter medicamentivorans]EHN11849.1 hypothetical protein PAI11_12670 [Patulibacter medicamentivorans]